eukprot:TRINITY_DN11919_c0_g1_i1.p1 TRINITY_DN11919_c0_g1~~TRINITY_DN11919_c0_g1_i1.p1  ORF type:complete len:257 (+),score=53.26 TRINITY_DN11919_c0_g1_i1:22-792(+)
MSHHKRKRNGPGYTEGPPTKFRQNETNRLFDSLLNEANDLLDTVLSCPVGAHKMVDEKEKSVLDFQKEEELLRRQLEFYKLASWKSGIVSPSVDQEELSSQIRSLQRELLQENNKLQQKQRLVKRNEEHQILQNLTKSCDHEQQDVEELKQITKTALLLRDSKVVALNQVTSAFKRLEEEDRALLQTIEMLSSKNKANIQHLDPIDKIEVDSKLQMDIHETLQHVIQMLVLNSELDWSKDPELEQVMTGKSVFSFQ